jgi:hypothetical protein
MNPFAHLSRGLLVMSSLTVRMQGDTSRGQVDGIRVDPHAVLLGDLIATHVDQLICTQPSKKTRAMNGFRPPGDVDPDLQSAVEIELENVLGAERLEQLRRGDGRDGLAEWIATRLAGVDGKHSREALWALFGGDDRALDYSRSPGKVSTDGYVANDGGGWFGRRRVWLVQQAAAALMNLVIACTVAVAWAVLWLLPGSSRPALDWPTLAMKGFALWCFAFLPCWLYVRFLGQRAGALWDEFVLYLHRLGWDQPRFLPRPPRTSQFYDEWAKDGGRAQAQDRNIYRQKFNSYYGRSVADAAGAEDFRVRLDTLFPVFLTAAVLSVGWTAVLWDVGFLSNPVDVWDVMKFGFLGAYVFIAQMLLRRFFASDLRPSAYTSALVRITVVLISVAAMYQLLEIWLGPGENTRRWEAVVAFTIGILPVVATQVIIRAAAALLRITTRSLDIDYPLNQLDGMNIWYEAQLAEENIDDMQNLTSANFVDVVLHTRVPVGRLVDWVDQSFLFLHLDRVEHGLRESRRARQGATDQQNYDDGKSQEDEPTPSQPMPPEIIDLARSPLMGSSVPAGSRGGTWTRTLLRQHGIRTATDLLKAFPLDKIDVPADAPKTAERIHLAEELEQIGAVQVRTLVRVLSEEPGLAPVWNWSDRGVRARCPHRQPQSVRACVVEHGPQLPAGH